MKGTDRMVQQLSFMSDEADRRLTLTSADGRPSLFKGDGLTVSAALGQLSQLS